MGSRKHPSFDRSRKRGRTEVNLLLPSQEQNFPKFLVVESVDNQFPLRKASPFVVANELEVLLGKYKAKKLFSGGLLIEVETKAQSQALQDTRKLANLDVKVSPHRSLNSTQGVISDPDLAELTEAQILEGVRKENVVAVRRINIRRNDIDIPTNHLVLTFNTTKLPESIQVGYVNYRVRPYIPNPRRCFKCQRFGHTLQSCRGKETCAKCSSTEHNTETCKTQDLKCVNCTEPHPAYSRKCKRFQDEKQIMSLKVKENISIHEARRRLSFLQKGTFAEVARRGTAPPQSTVGTQVSFVDLVSAQPPKQNTLQPQAQAPKKSGTPEAEEPQPPSAPPSGKMPDQPSVPSASVEAMDTSSSPGNAGGPKTPSTSLGRGRREKPGVTAPGKGPSTSKNT